MLRRWMQSLRDDELHRLVEAEGYRAGSWHNCVVGIAAGSRLNRCEAVVGAYLERRAQITRFDEIWGPRRAAEVDICGRLYVTARFDKLCERFGCARVGRLVRATAARELIRRAPHEPALAQRLVGAGAS